MPGPADPLDRLTSLLSDRYRVERELGQGGMAVVYLAFDRKHERNVAIKVLRPDVAAALGPERFLREIKLTARLTHPHILPLLDSGEADGLLYYVMPFVEGESLRDRLSREQRLPLEEALRITREVADALASAHRHGVVHRDIKPENVLLEEGHAVVSDFGIARAVAASGGDRLTATGLAVGTPIYMSPEQIRGEPTVDGRADVYSLACVLYEMLAGQPPFSGPSVEAIIARRFSEPAPRVSSVREAVPEHVDRALRRALAESPEQRFAAATDFAAALATPGWTTPPAGLDLRTLVTLGRNPRVSLPAVALVLALIALVVIPQRRQRARERAASLLPGIAQLADAGRYGEAYGIAVRAERVLRSDTTLARLMPVISDRLTVTSDPAGAAVYIERFTPDGADRAPDSTFVGHTPVRDLRVARGDYRVVVARQGFTPVERIASGAVARADPVPQPGAGDVAVHVRLRPAGDIPPDMVFVPGGRYELVSPALPTGLAVELAGFFMDRYEVTNEDYRAFIVGGGYATRADWPARFEADGRELSWEGVLMRMRDRTGLPGPRSWTGQEYPAGRERHPVTDVTWYEAAAYCASVGKRLPTAFEWDKAARDGKTTYLGVLMPWGYLEPGEASARRANFGGRGTVPVDRHPFGISPYGAYTMAGNVKEWLQNPMGAGFAVTGGSWEDPVYVYASYGALPALSAAPTLGFRCARTAAAATGDQGAARLRIEQRTPSYTPVDAARFETFLTHYRYDRRPLEATVVETVETTDWTRETVRYVALEGDTAVAHLFLPKRAAPPLQTVVYVPSAGAFTWPVAEEVTWLIGPNIKAGRAVFAVVFQGMAGRERPPGWRLPEPNSVRFRDLMVLHATELRRGLDYLETRPEIDARKLAYVGLSWGAGSRLVFAALDDRFRAVVLIGGGIDERVQPTVPEASNINFAPYIRPPKLLLNGQHDEEHPWYTRALPLWNLLREPKELVLVEGAGHIPPLEARVPAINEFLDRTLGPVAPRVER